MQKLSRVCIVLSVVCLVVACYVVPATASGLDYIDYVVDVFTHDGVEMCTVKIPASEFGPGVWYVRWGNTGSGAISGHSFTYTFNSNTTYALDYRPTQNGNVLLAYDIPDGTQLSVSTKVSLGIGSGNGFSTPQERWYVEYLNSSYTRTKLSYGTWADGGLYDAYNIFSIEKPEDTYALNFGLDYRYFTTLDGPLEMTITVEYINLTMTISSLYLQYIQNGRNNQILNAVEDTLVAQGKTLQDVLEQQDNISDQLEGAINGTVDPERPSGSDSFEDLNDAESDLRDDAQSALDKFLELNDTTHEGLEPYLSALFAVGYIFELFADMPFFGVLLGVSLCLGLTGTILGIFHGVHSKGDGVDYAAAKKEILEKNHRGG